MSTTANAPAADNQPGNTALRSAASPSADIIPNAPDNPEDEDDEEEAARAVGAERQRVSQLVEIDAKSTVSPELASAIAQGTSAADFAVAQAKANKTALINAKAAAKADAVSGSALPEGGVTASGSTPTAPTNRGQAYVAKRKAAAQSAS